MLREPEVEAATKLLNRTSLTSPTEEWKELEINEISRNNFLFENLSEIIGKKSAFVIVNVVGEKERDHEFYRRPLMDDVQNHGIIYY